MLISSGTVHMKMCSDVNDRFGTLHIKVFSDVLTKAGTPHTCWEVETLTLLMGGTIGVGTPHNIEK